MVECQILLLSCCGDLHSSCVGYDTLKRLCGVPVFNEELARADLDVVADIQKGFGLIVQPIGWLPSVVVVLLPHPRERADNV
jgi:hypothetical protein